MIDERANLFKSYLHTALVVGALLLASSLSANADAGQVSGKILDPLGVPVAGASLKLLKSAAAMIREAKSDEQGGFILGDIDPGGYQLPAEEPKFVSVTLDVSVVRGQQTRVTLQFAQLASVSQAITVVASAPSLLTPDPAQSIVIHDQVWDANPGRPGAPISIPGLPIETASGGIKAPTISLPALPGIMASLSPSTFRLERFFIQIICLPMPTETAMPIRISSLLRRLKRSRWTAEPLTFGKETTLSISRPHTYQRNVSTASSRSQVTIAMRMSWAGWSPSNPKINAWLALEASYGNGFLERLEHRQQYKLNGLRQFNIARHELTLFGIGYYGFSDIPGLIPINVPVPGDTIDNRQLDCTYTALLVATDNWKLSEEKQFSFSGFLRNYALTLRSNFGDGLIQQSESRNVAGGEATYVESVRPWLSLLAGVDLRRDAPRNLDLKRVDDEGVFQPVTSNNLTLSFAEPFVSLDGRIGKYFHYDVGVRQEQVWMDNQDIINPRNSFNKLATLTLPKGTLTLLPPNRWHLPTVAFSYGDAFHTEDSRIGTGTGQPTLLSPSRAYQLVFSKLIKQTQLYVTLRRVSNSQELAKISDSVAVLR